MILSKTERILKIERAYGEKVYTDTLIVTYIIDLPKADYSTISADGNSPYIPVYVRIDDVGLEIGSYKKFRDVYDFYKRIAKEFESSYCLNSETMLEAVNYANEKFMEEIDSLSAMNSAIDL